MLPLLVHVSSTTDQEEQFIHSNTRAGCHGVPFKGHIPPFDFWRRFAGAGLAMKETGESPNTMPTVSYIKI